MERSKVTFLVAMVSLLHNHPSSTLMAFCAQSPNSGALPCQEASCLGSRRPVCTRPRLSCNYGLYLPACRPTRTRHVSQRDSGFSNSRGRARRASIGATQIDKGVLWLRPSPTAPPSEAEMGTDFAPSCPSVGRV